MCVSSKAVKIFANQMDSCLMSFCRLNRKEGDGANG